MRVWLVETGEPVPVIDDTNRPMRCGMLTRALLQRGHSVTWWTSTFDHFSKRHRYSHTTHKSPLAGYDVHLLHGPPYSRNISLARVRHNRAIAREFRRQLASDVTKPDLIFASFPTLEMADVAVGYAKRLRVPAVVDVRDLWPDTYVTAVPAPFRPILRMLVQPEYRRARRALAGAVRITAMSESILRRGLEMSGRERRSADQWFPLSFPGLGRLERQASTDPTVLNLVFTGTLGTSQDVRTLIQAVVSVASSGRKIHLRIAGEGEQGTALRDLARDSKSVEFLGWLSSDDLQSLLASSEVGIMSYRTGATQTLSNKVYEYMAAGLAIVSSLDGDFDRLLQAEGLGVKYRPEDVNDLASKLSWLCDHPSERAAFGSRAADLFQTRFSEAIVYSQFVDYLEDACNA